MARRRFKKGQVVHVVWGNYARVEKYLGPREYLGKTSIHWEVSGFEDDPTDLQESMMRPLNKRERGVEEESKP